MTEPHDHAGCDCAAHRRRATAAATGDTPTADAAPGLLASLGPALACAVCPACLTTYAKVFSSAGAGFGVSDAFHEIILGVAVVASVGLSAWRTRRTGRRWPLVTALVGATAIVVGHAVEGLHALEWMGVLILLVGGLTEHFRLRSQQARARAAVAVPSTP
jgi:hypothetical protein